MKGSDSDIFSLLKILAKHQIDFVVVGGVSAVLHGAPITTFDLDIVHSCETSNVARLMEALRELEAYYRVRRDIRIAPEKSHLEGRGHHLLMTNHGPLDLLGIVGAEQDYRSLLDESEIIEVENLEVRVQGLESLIRVKEHVGRAKDIAIIPILRRTLAEKQ